MATMTEFYRRDNDILLARRQSGGRKSPRMPKRRMYLSK
jgi:hypothetical protein